jgi:hypothetical protein
MPARLRATALAVRGKDRVLNFDVRWIIFHPDGARTAFRRRSSFSPPTTCWHIPAAERDVTIDEALEAVRARFAPTIDFGDWWRP